MAQDSSDFVGVSAVVRDDDGRVLLIKTARDGWELLGGQVEPGEDFITALERGVREETGCEIDVGGLTGVTSSADTPRLTVFTFMCQAPQSQATTRSMRRGFRLTLRSVWSPIRSSSCG